MKVCPIEGCSRPVRARGLCAAHYHRLRAHGDPTGGKTPRGELLRYIREVVLPYDGDGCLRWPYSNAGGYGFVQIDGRNKRVTRLVCEHIYGPPPTPKHQAAHLCGNGHEGCCAPNHLAWKTCAENHADKLVHGTSNRGERHGQSKVTTPQVLEIKAMLRGGGLSQQKIADRFGVTQTLVSRISRGETWGWLEAA